MQITSLDQRNVAAQEQVLLPHTLTSKALLGFDKKSTNYSPLSLFASLLLLCRCSNDESIKQLTQKLNINPEQLFEAIKQMQKDQSLSLAFNIYDKYLEHIQPSFTAQMQKDFGFVPEKLVSTEQVNSWCAKHTRDKITQIITDVDFDVLLISALYFKAEWQTKFEARLTHKCKFNAFSQQTEVQMMQMEKQLRYKETTDAQIVELPYINSSIQARIILPLKQGEVGFINALSEQNMHAQTSNQLVRLLLPKFKIESTFDLNDLLKQLGATIIFDNIDCMSTLGKPLKVEKVIQKTFLSVDEEGTEAGAVTAVRMLCGCARDPPKPIVVACDKPFWFVLMGQRGEVLFIASKVE